ncbi:MAG: FMN-binding protein, partial [Verrucomicrobiales bacterium]|nr:FMN-binding protein [Verrucomicrobiales bacterium]
GAGRRRVVDGEGVALGWVSMTAPGSDRFIGYSGPTNLLIVWGEDGRTLGVRILRSADTAEHVAEVVADRGFFRQFVGKTAAELSESEVRGVTGATLTSSAIAESLAGKEGAAAAGMSQRFPEPITLEEVQALRPEAVELLAEASWPGVWRVMDAGGKTVARVTRTAGVADAVIGYKGPTDTLMLLSADGERLEAMRLRRSYDTKRYVAYVTGDDYFLNLFAGRPLVEMAGLDFQAEKVEGVSGATETSWAVAEGVKRRAEELEGSRRALTWLPEGMRWRWRDTGHGLMILSALVMAFTNLRGRKWVRHGHHFLLVVYGGFIAGEMLSQGLLAGWAVHGAPWRSAPGLVALAVVALLGPIFTRRQLYCHHLCPHGALQQLLARRLPWQWTPGQRVERVLKAVPWLLLALVVGVVMLNAKLPLNALEPFDAYALGVAAAVPLLLAVVGVVAALFAPLAYCRYGCPTGALFRLLRYTGDADHPGWRDLTAALLLLITWRLSDAI